MSISWVGRGLVALAGLVGLAAQAGTVTYFHNDVAGSPVVATNEAGAVVWRESYRPYGERLVNSASAAGNKLWFTSRRQDSTGLVYMGARYYDPVVGRFISTDPAGFDEKSLHSFNRYAYANNNPYRYVDPDGLWVEDVALAIPGLIVGAVSLGVHGRGGRGVRAGARDARTWRTRAYPNDASGDAFRRLEAHGFDSSVPHPVEFFAQFQRPSLA